jgi:serine/threonine protein kinase
MATSWSFREGEQIAPGLVALRLLGGGSSYEAHLAFDELRYAPVVVKIVRPHLVDDRHVLRGLEREVDVLGHLNHPTIVRGFHAVLDGPRPLVVLESLDGPRLSSLVRRHGPLPLQQLLPLAIELCSAVHYLRQRDVVHLDIKPSNIIMGAPARLIDLSVARDSAAAAALHEPIGTDDYMAPEQCAPRVEAAPGFATDMWGVGTTLFHAASGYLPFDRGSKAAGAMPSLRWPQIAIPPYELPAGVPGDVSKGILACLAIEPDARPSPVELAEMVEPVLSSMPKPRLSGFKVSAF